jgi:hypothetical protein
MTGILLLQVSRNPELPSREGSCSRCGYCGDVVLLEQVFAGITTGIAVKVVLA